MQLNRFYEMHVFVNNMLIIKNIFAHAGFLSSS